MSLDQEPPCDDSNCPYRHRCEGAADTSELHAIYMHNVRSDEPVQICDRARRGHNQYVRDRYHARKAAR